MSTLPASLLSTASPSFSPDAARASNTRTQAASGSFSQLLRDFDKPPAMDSKPSPVDAAPKPSAESAPQHASEGKTETQRQEAKLKPTTKKSEPHAPKDAKGPAAAPETDSASAAAPSTGDGVTPTEAQTDDDTAETGKAAKSVKAEDTPAAIAPPTAALQLPVTTPLSLPQALGAADKSPSAEGDMATETEGAVKPKSAAKTAAAAARDPDTTQGTSDTASKAADFASLIKDAAQALPTLARGASESMAQPASAAIDGLLSAAAQGAQSPAAARSGDVSSPPVVSLAQPLYEAGFAPELAARLSLMAADGVQEAQLHLNPAEMGPVAVQIVVEGQQAHISFHADQADTRAVLERSLPDLAAALRDSGLTLSGGGVFQQSAGQDRQAEAGGQSAPRQRSRDVSDALPSISRAAPPSRASRGVVDLYA